MILRRSLAAPLLLLATLAGALSTSCVGSVYAPVSVSPSARPLPASAAPTGELFVGATKVDITPAPGLSLLGHGPEGRVSQGTLLRLHCQAFVLAQEMADPDDAANHHEEAVAFVPCDLSWPSLLLQRTVAKLLRDRGIPIGPERLVLSATHTHASPAHYLGAADYSGPLSTDKPGYSQCVVDFLAGKIADAVTDAYKNKKAGCIAWRKASFHDTDADLDKPDRGHWIEGFRFGKNRSIEAFAKDDLEPDEITLFTDPRTGSPKEEDRRSARPSLFAIDGTMSVLRLETTRTPHDCAAGHTDSIGAFTVVGVHPTVIPNLNDLYHGDIFGYATREMETLAAEDHDAHVAKGFVSGIANGPEGDVSPLVDYQGTREARRLGVELASQIAKLWKEAATHLTDKLPLRTAYREVVLTGARAETHNDFYRSLRRVYPFPGKFRSTASACNDTAKDPVEWRSFDEGCDPMLCDVAGLGAAAAGGAKDGRTFFIDIPEMREGSIAPLSRSCQAPKLELDTPLSEEFGFPQRAPLHVVLVGGELVTTFPGEIATLPAYRARRQLERYLETQPGVDSAVLASRAGVVQIGLTGEYFQYITTSEEFGAQQYEGASTLYGPNEGRFIANQQVCIARHLFEGALTADEDHECTLDYRAGTGMPRAFQPRIGDVTEVEFQPSGKRSGKVTAKCSDSRTGSFGPSGEPDYVARLKKTRILRNNPLDVRRVDIYRVERDGEDGYGVHYLPPPDCRDVEQQPRARVVDVKTGKELASDEGDGFELRWIQGEWRIAWYPSARDWETLKHVSPEGIEFQVGPTSNGPWLSTTPLCDAPWPAR